MNGFLGNPNAANPPHGNVGELDALNILLEDSEFQTILDHPNHQNIDKNGPYSSIGYPHPQYSGFGFDFNFPLPVLTTTGDIEEKSIDRKNAAMMKMETPTSEQMGGRSTTVNPNEKKKAAALGNNSTEKESNLNSAGSNTAVGKSLEDIEKEKERARDRARRSRKRRVERMENLEECNSELKEENEKMKAEKTRLEETILQLKSANAAATVQQHEQQRTHQQHLERQLSVRDMPATPAELKIRHQTIVHLTRAIQSFDFKKIEDMIHAHCVLFNPGDEWEVYGVEGITNFFQRLVESIQDFTVIDDEIQPLDHYGDKFRNRWTVKGSILKPPPGASLQEEYLFKRAKGQPIEFSGTSIYFFRRNQIVMCYRTWNPVALMLQIMRTGS